MRAIARIIYERILGWNLVGEFPQLDKYVVAVAPHTSNWDFFIGLLVRTLSGVRINYIGKKSLFRPPFGWFFRYTGGAPVDRRRNADTVRAIAALFRERAEFRLGLSPEGTRKPVPAWRTGFYYIAMEAGVPIVFAALDYGKKQVRLSEPFYPTGQYAQDLEIYHAFFRGVRGKNPENGYPA
ncbi:lysophospholipid acyltransferase family protein [Robiginitalea biformata]|uniref:Phospholipid/glycerol acyltransferase domain-containing protein n=1 Tax=Robiginitalea biformata (strain ATCC BAA-864 / DSM 15991 / KCTC 12146 / HTCC2501) TaxID=313596 RepID=A4CK26_ROBBH|nr:lysophospholipid acyltransferase family protein [Robiginitalea biformata]EAR15225.1 hypothetical protein RB2501_12894 [Robiginitalea biformata HTCC2501]